MRDVRRYERLVRTQLRLFEGCVRAAGRGYCDRSYLDDAIERGRAAVAWLEDGLPDACRTSGRCLPGWVR